ncbi:conserved hypothetical protein, partial [Streptomyces viridosporus ATCC 14672]
MEARPDEEGPHRTGGHRPGRGGEADTRRTHPLPAVRLARPEVPRAAGGDLEAGPLPDPRPLPHGAADAGARTVHARVGPRPRRRRPGLRGTHHPRHPQGPPPMTTVHPHPEETAPMTTALPPAPARQIVPPEDRYAAELAFLAAYDDGPRPPAWRLTPRAVVTFVMGSDGRALKLPDGAEASEGVPRRLVIEDKFVGDRALVERCVVTLAGERGLLLVGEPGTAKSMLSELLAAAVCGTSGLVVQGTAGTTEDQLKYGWNYALLLAQGPTRQALVPSPVLTAMSRGAVARVEEVTRCLPEVQDSLVSLLSERRIAVPELAGTEDALAHAAPGFNLIATANLRDKGVSEMSAALKRRFNFETVGPIGDLDAETALVRSQARASVARAGAPWAGRRRRAGSP